MDLIIRQLSIRRSRIKMSQMDFCSLLADLKGDFFSGRAKTNDDNGLMNFTKKETDKHRFRVPTLRNVELTCHE